jgi:hypothetical protein
VFGVFPIHTTDASGDGVGGLAHCTPTSTWTTSSRLGTHDSYTVDFCHGRATWADGGLLYWVDGMVDMPVAGTTVFCTGTPCTGLAEPRLSPEGDEMFVRDDNMHTLSVLKFQGGAWQLPLQVSVEQLAIQSAALPGTPTARAPGLPRRMLLNNTDGASPIVYELEEKADLMWTAKQIQPAPSTLTSLNLMPDGLTMVYSVSIGSNRYAIDYQERVTRDSPWQGENLVTYTTQIRGDDPFIAYDCGHLYASLAGVNTLYQP